METNQKEKKSRNKEWLVLALLLLGGNMFFAWLWNGEKGRANVVVIERQQVIAERDNVKADLLSLQEEYATLQTSDKALQAELDAKRAEIAELLEEAEQHKGDAYVIGRLKKETETLRSIMKHFVGEIDSLNTLNKTILAEKDKVSADLDAEKNKASQLSKDKEALQSTVYLGSILRASNPIVQGIKFKSGGTKEVETTKASKVERIKVSFSLAENKIAKQGVKPVYVRLTSPDGKEICKSPDESNMVSFNGSRGYYAAKKEVNYKNEEVSLAILCASPDGFVAGKYLVDIVCEDAIVGQSSIVLK
jgi:hypothetical protein